MYDPINEWSFLHYVMVIGLSWTWLLVTYAGVWSFWTHEQLFTCAPRMIAEHLALRFGAICVILTGVGYMSVQLVFWGIQLVS